MPNHGLEFVVTFVTWTLRVAGVILILFFLAGKRIPRNRWGGIRFSYTLADDEVWRKVHDRCRWFFLAMAVLCFYPLSCMRDVLIVSALVGGIAIGMAVGSFLYARKTYRAKFGTTKVVSAGFLKYAPPNDATGAEDKSD